jgi:hypothetical protein
MHMKSQAAVSSSISTNAVAAQVSGLASQRLNTVSISINGAKAASFNFFGTPTVSASSGTVSISGTSTVLGAPANTNNAANTNNSATPGPAFISVTHTEPVAEVISNGDYAPLGIKKGFNCLILTWISPPTAVPISIADRRTAIKASYRAWMVPVALESQCLTIQSTLAIPPSPGSLQLAVNALDVATGDKIPAVTRWDWDSVSQKQYVGMICPTGWCEFHQPKVNFTSSRLHTPPVSMSPNGYLLGQKPWYDEQVLADPKSGSSGLRPSQQRVLGTLVPVPGLETRDMNFYKTGWQDAAWVALDKDDENYKSKYGFQKNNPVLSDAGKTTVALCYRQKATDTNCGTGIPTCEGNAKVLPDSGLFFARISGVNNANPKYFCVAYRPSKNNLQPPGVVRWRWTLKDETIWIACPAGCCEVDAIAS